jgi:hypothetical protein
MKQATTPPRPLRVARIRRLALSVGCSLGLLPGTAPAGPRTSTNYTLPTDTTDAGGQRTTSASYTNDGSAGGIVGISTVAAPAETAKHGYVGQLYEVTGLAVSATPTTVNETATRQLDAAQLLDDATTLAVPAASVAWSVAGGPLTGIDASGLATAGIVYQATAATAQGIYLGQTGTLGLTVLDSIPDNFGTYAGDQVGDDWQVQYFGQPPNAFAGPLLDPDGDGQANLFEFTAGLVPTDPASRFRLSIAPVTGQPGQKNLIFSPVVAGRTYAAKAKASLTSPTWGDITASAPSDNGAERTITDLSATGGAKFYHIEITQP